MVKSSDKSSFRGRPDKTGGTQKAARCSASGSLSSALSKAAFIICSEFRLQGDRPVFTGKDCLQLRREWDEWTSSVRIRRGRGNKRKKFESIVKGSKRIFDFPCVPCDKVAALASQLAWRKHVSVKPKFPSPSWCHDPIWLLKKRVRELVSGWGGRLEEKRKESGEVFVGPADCRERNCYVPDQQGCLETSKLEGGTLATAPEECSLDDSLVRAGVAKTKGKFRTVTMQSARVKRVLRPVHTALYDHLSSFGWLVRGDVTRADFDAVFNDLQVGEKIISGDYTAATDNIYQEAVLAIVEVLSEDQDLEEEERKVLVGSFTNLRWVSRSGKQWPILRGSMMGNLVSFPILCLLNKACYDITCDIFFGSGVRRISRMNGDDCLFAGTREFFALWRKVTGAYGLIVNESKTGIEDYWADLNSQPCSRLRKGLNPKPGLSFLRPFRKEPDSILREVWQGIQGLKLEVQAWVLNVAMRHEIAIRTMDLSEIPRKTILYLLTKSWFRRARQLGPLPVEKVGTRRVPSVTLANPPRPEFYDWVSAESDAQKKRFVEAWTGVGLHGTGRDPFTGEKTGRPEESFIVRQAFRQTEGIRTEPEKWWWDVGSPSWKFLWPTPMLRHWEKFHPERILSDEESREEWIDDHPFLQRKVELVKVGPTSHHYTKKNFFSPPSLGFLLPTGGFSLPRGYGKPEPKERRKRSIKCLGDGFHSLLLALARRKR